MSKQGDAAMLVTTETGLTVWECNVCGGEVEELGILARELWGRCVDCGLDQHRPLEVPAA